MQHDPSLRVRAERIRMAYRQLPAVLGANAVIALLFAGALWQGVPIERTMGWLAVQVVVTSGRVGLWLCYQRSKTAYARVGRWARLFTAGAAVSGLVWGSTALLFIDAAVPQSLLVVSFVIAGMSAGAVPGLSFCLPAFALYLLCATAPLAVRLIAAPDRASVVLGGMVVVFALGVGWLGRSYHRSLTRDLELGDERARLLEATEAEVEMRTAELQAAKEEAGRHAQQLDGILSTITDHVFMLCWSGVMMYANPAATGHFAIPEPVFGRRWADVGLSAEEVATLESLHATVMETRTSITADVAIGERRYEYRLTPMTEPDGRIGAVMAVARDITARIAAAEEIRAARGQAEQADQAKSRFLAAASHDLRQPMQSTFLFAGVLRRQLRDAQALQTLGMVERGLETLKGLLESLLDVSRLDANVIEPQMEVFALRPLLAEIGAAYVPLAAIKGLELTVEGDAALHVRSDRTLLGRMVRNLVENAVRYTEAGNVRIAAARTDSGAAVEVTDTGLGIPADQLHRIFEEFHQVGEHGGEHARGFGLGLSIVRRLSAALGHEVTVRSAPDAGSTFCINLPAVAAVDAGAVAAEADAAPGQGRTVMIVDDDIIVLLGLRAIIEAWGYRPLTAGTLEQAVAAVRNAEAKPVVVIADYRLRSGAAGTAAVTAVREAAGKPLPGIILTGETAGESMSDAARLGLRLIQKPVTPTQLARVLEETLAAEV